VHETCGLCKSKTRFIKLKSCDDPFLICNCNILNKYHKWGLAKKYCATCFKAHVLPDEFEKEYSVVIEKI